MVLLSILPLLMLGSARVFADEDWNIKIKTDDGLVTVPFDSTGLLSLDNFTVSSLDKISDLAYNATISELSFRVELTAEEFARTQGTNVNITLPSAYANFKNVSDTPILIYIFVDGAHNGYIMTPKGEVNELGFCVYEGSHRVSLQILDPPLVPEMSMPIVDLILASLFLEALLAAKLYVKLKQRKIARVLRTLASFFV